MLMLTKEHIQNYVRHCAAQGEETIVAEPCWTSTCLAAQTLRYWYGKEATVSCNNMGAWLEEEDGTYVAFSLDVEVIIDCFEDSATYRGEAFSPENYEQKGVTVQMLRDSETWGMLFPDEVTV